MKQGKQNDYKGHKRTLMHVKDIFKKKGMWPTKGI